MEKWARINYHPCLPIGKNKTKITECKKHTNLARKVASEGIVLLKNEKSLLPLNKNEKIAIFGKAQIDYVKCGGGSGDVYPSYTINVYQGLKNKGYMVFDKLSSYYSDYVTDMLASGEICGNFDEAEIPYDLIKEAKTFTSTAIFTVCRHSKEGEDYKTDGKGFYLTEKESALLKEVTSNFANVIVVINTGTVFDASFYFDNDKIQSVLMAWQGGQEGGNAIADVISGDVNPSGKLVDTIAKSLDDYPSTARFYESDEYAVYDEDVFVGYRYFETIPNKKDRVYYPFGFGLSYTNFEFTDITARLNNGKITLELTVNNVGSFSGKEVVQVYYKAPNGKITKPAINLCDFYKTRLIAPFSSQKVKFTLNVNNFASFDDTGAICKSAWVLEKGKYELFVGSSVRNLTAVDIDITLSSDLIVKKVDSLVLPRRLDKRLTASGEYINAVNTDLPLKTYSVPPCLKHQPPTSDESIVKLIDVYENKTSLDEFLAQLTNDELIDILHNRLRGIGSPYIGVSSTGGIGGGLTKYSIPTPLSIDGPAGVRIYPKTGITTTCFPIATMLACTFNPQLVKMVGVAGAKECIENNLSIWLTPALNIHRSPVCGRNFEYYSEAPFISGKMASAMVKGIQSQKIVATVKHFACNNKETNRLKSDSIVSERALREIYLKGFEICVKEAKPRLLMTSYNKLNGYYTSENSELITGILRREWKYKGLVVTDWANLACHEKELLAGNDIKIFYYDLELSKKLPRKVLVRSAKKLLEMILWLD